GTGGTADILNPTTKSFAIIPSYQAAYAPFAPYNSNSSSNIATNNLPKVTTGTATLVDPGYTFGNPKFQPQVGEQIDLTGGGGLPAGSYTILPARYALLPGAFLVTPESGTPTGAVDKSDGSSLVSGYYSNGFSPLQNQTLFLSFELASDSVVRQRAQYDEYSANTFISQSASQHNQAVPLLPVDSGQLVLTALTQMTIDGKVASQPLSAAGRGGVVDIDSPSNILIVGPDANPTPAPGTLVLNSGGLDNFGAESLLIGGVRQTTPNGTTVAVDTSTVEVDNAAVLSGPEVILAANNNLSVDDGAVIEQKGNLSGPAETLQIGQTYNLNNGNTVLNNIPGGAAIGVPGTIPSGDNLFANSVNGGIITPANGGAPITFAAGANVSINPPAGSTITFNNGVGSNLTANFGANTDIIPLTIGDGTLLRVSSDPSASITRAGVTRFTSPSMTIGQGAQGVIGAQITGASVTLDSTGTTTLASNAALSATALNLDSGRIGIQFGGSGSPPGLVLSGDLLNELESSGITKSLSLLSYSSIDIYGSGQIGSSAFQNLALHAGEIDDDNDVNANGITGSGDSVTFAAQNILLDNSSNATPRTIGSLPTNNPASIAFDTGAGTIELGANQLDINQFNSVTLQADGGITAQGLGTPTPQGTYLGLTTQGSLAMQTPLLTGATGARQTITAGGSLSIANLDAAPRPASPTGTALRAPLGVRLILIGAQNGVTNTTINDGTTIATDGVTIDSNIVLPSGTLNVEADHGDLSVYNGGKLDASGQPWQFFDATEYTSGGQITLTSDNGKVDLTGSTINVSAQPQAGNAGSLTISAPTGTFTVVANALSGQGGAGGQAGTFSLDVGSLNQGTSLDSLSGILSGGGFTQSVSIRDRGDSSVTLDATLPNSSVIPTLKAHTVNLSADAGSIDIAGTIDASGIVPIANFNTPPPTNGVINWDGQTGGVISLAAFGDVKLEGALTAEGLYYNDASQGGEISITAGTYNNTLSNILNANGTPAANRTGYVSNSVNNVPVGAVKINGGTIDLKVDNPYTTSDIEAYWTSLANGGPIGVSPNNTGSLPGGGTLLLSAPQTLATQAAAYPGGVAIAPVNGMISGSNASNVVVEGYKVYTPVNGVIDTIDAVNTGIVYTDAQGFVTQPHVTAIDNLFSSLSGNTGIQVEPGAEIVNSTAPAFLRINGSPTLAPGASLAASNGTIVQFNSGGTIIFNSVSSNIKSSAAGTIINASGVSRPLNIGTNAIFVGDTVSLASGTITLNGSDTITNSTGNLTLNNTWDLSTFRFGPNVDVTPGDGSGEPGILTLRAAGNLVFNYNSSTKIFASLSDGFDQQISSSGLWQAQLLPDSQRETLSWSYNLVAGADLTAADFSRVMPMKSLAANTGSLLLGAGGPALPSASSTSPATLIPKYYQVIRTGTGDINIFAGQNVELLNSLATIYTAGTQAAPLLNFDNPDPVSIANFLTNSSLSSRESAVTPIYPAQFSFGGGNVTVSAQADIIHELINLTTGVITQDSSKELPTSWLYRRGYVNASGQFAPTNTLQLEPDGQPEVASTSWWIDFGNFLEGVGALGGGNVALLAGNNITNVDAVVPTNARMSGRDSSGNPIAPNAANLVELGGGDLTVNAGNNINGGVYYVERGSGTLSARNQILTNSTRAAVTTTTVSPDPTTWLPTTFFVGQGSFDVTAGGDLLLGPVANPFLLPQGINNNYFEKTYFSTYATTDAVDVSSLTGNVILKDDPANSSGSLFDWYNNVLNGGTSGAYAKQQPWLNLAEQTLPSYFNTAATIMPGTLQAVAFSGDLDLVGSLTLSPSPMGTVDLLAAGSINGVQPNALITQNQTPIVVWASSEIDLSDANPASLPGITDPVSPYTATTVNPKALWSQTSNVLFSNFSKYFEESGSFTGTYGALQTQQDLHADLPIDPGNPTSPLGPLHYNDPNPLQLYAANGDISGVTLFSGKEADVLAGQDITDISLYIQNDKVSDVSLVAAGRNILAYDPNSPLRLEAQTTGNQLYNGGNPQLDASLAVGTPTAGDIQISGPGTIEVLAGGNFDLGAGASNADGTSVGLTSIGNARNPALPSSAGANVTVGAGLGATLVGLDSSKFDNNLTTFIAQFLGPTSSYWPDLLSQLNTLLPSVDFSAGLPAVWSGTTLTDAQRQVVASNVLDVFYFVLRDAGRAFNDPSSPSYKNNYNTGFAAIKALFPGNAWQGDISLSSRNIKTEKGGDIDLFAPGGQLTLGGLLTNPGGAPPGIVTERGGNISIFTNGGVNVGSQRIFTLFGGNEIIWSSTGDIAAGNSSKTIQTAPPTAVLVDPQSANVTTDPAGLATGGGIGVLASVAGVAPGDVDLIAPNGTIDA
ncbi:MAG TPA: filamentous hemagglutinin family protein, partial [Gemmataceae bacterium]|nr:filamentous hemagglutinin family protein [Gemmataceae bacterium]